MVTQGSFRFEIFSLTPGAIGVMAGFAEDAKYFLVGAASFVAAYLYAIQIRRVDNKRIWK